MFNFMTNFRNQKPQIVQINIFFTVMMCGILQSWLQDFADLKINNERLLWF